METWKDIPWYEWLYQVNKKWHIKALPKYFRRKVRILKPDIDKDWYLKVKLTINKQKKSFFIHRLVLITFIWHSDLVCNHKNWIKDDNRLENLEWCTISENQKHKFRVLWYKNNFHLNHPNKKQLWTIPMTS